MSNEQGASMLIRNGMIESGTIQSDMRENYAKTVAAPALASALNASRVWLFGSAARGHARKNSDIDLLVEGGDGISGKRRLAIAYDIIESLDDIPCGIDVVVLTEEEIREKSTISSIKSMLADRKLVYAR